MSVFARLMTAAFAGVFILSASACDGLLDQLKSNDVAIATLLKTPDAKNPSTGELVPGHTSFTLFFGSVDKTKVIPKGDAEGAEDGAFKGNAGAKVTLHYSDAKGVARELNIPDTGDGKYALDSSDSQLDYSPTARYRVDIFYAGKTFSLNAIAPAASKIAEFKEKDVITEHKAGADFTVTRAGTPNPDTNSLAFVNLMGVSGSDDSATYSNMPSEGLDFLRLVLADQSWRQNAFVVPGEHFKAGAQYLVTLTSVERGTSNGPSDGTEALFPGSSFLVGVGAAGGILTEGQIVPLPDDE